MKENNKTLRLALVVLLLTPTTYYTIIFGKKLGENFGSDIIRFFETASILQLFIVVIVAIILPSIFFFWTNTKTKKPILD